MDGNTKVLDMPLEAKIPGSFWTIFWISCNSEIGGLYKHLFSIFGLKFWKQKCDCMISAVQCHKSLTNKHLQFIIFVHISIKAQWYRVLNKRVQWLFFDNILTIFWQIPFIVLALSDKKFSGLMVRRHAFHTEIWGSIPLAGSFTFFF